MSQGRAIDPIDVTQFPTEQDVSDPGFEQLTSDLLGNAATDADGWNDDIDVANGLLDSLDAALDTLAGLDGGTLDDTFAEILSVDPAPAGDDVVNLSAALPDVQSNVDNLGNLLTGAGLPAPPGPAAPLPAGCNAVLGFDTKNNTVPFERDVNFTGGQGDPRRTIDSIILTQDTPNLFHLIFAAVGTNPDTQTIVLKITLLATAPDGMHGKVTIKWNLQDGNERTTVLCLGVNVPDNFG